MAANTSSSSSTSSEVPAPPGEDPAALAAGPLTPQPPTTPKPAKLQQQVSLRHRFVNHSVGSLTTAVATRDNIDDFRGNEASDSSDIFSNGDSESAESSEEDDVAQRRVRSSRRDSIQSPKTGSRLAPVVEAITPIVEEDASIDCCRASCGSERDPSELDAFLDDEAFRVSEQPLLHIDEGVLPATAMARCPPISWLRVAGFDVPSSRGFDAAPVAPVCGEKPTRYLDLFSRQMLARERSSDLTVGSLVQHDVRMGRVRHTSSLPVAKEDGAQNLGEILAQNGEWLQAFIAKARAAPMHTMAEQVMGVDLGHGVASFLDRLSDVSAADASVAPDDLADGRHVTGLSIRMRPVQRGRGRAGFIVDGDVAIETPGRSQSPQPRHVPPPIPLEAPRPPLIAGSVQPFSQRRRMIPP
mmetsp:Transcript_16513/g.47898  ORF Transcript_16513/g.47898 Transcript_16513/m.47898 type:complete len:413 (-) Transcript_16513:358-1596(-)